MPSHWDWLPWDLQLRLINIAMRKGPRRLVAGTLGEQFVFAGYTETGYPFYASPVINCISLRGWSMALL